ncbi:MAG TPA: VacJ family lipoprotein [Alphaproteobacteria bacterium]|nr:VacJ family lipoprotein [Alphaproteobacteria bacterium]
MPASTNNKQDRRLPRLGLSLGSVLLASALVGGCATPPTDPAALASFNEANDPLEPMNRDIFDFNLALDDNIVKPVAQVYGETPAEFRKGMHNMIQTVRSPDVFMNQMLQGDVDGAADTVLRLLINLTVGLAGFFDVAADRGGVKAHDTDFGVTLGKWGVDEGPYLMLPLFGPSNPRDATGLVVDNFADPVGYYATFGQSVARAAYEGIDKREPLIAPLDEIRRTSVDYYATLRSLYRQRRQDQITKGASGSNIVAPSIEIDEMNDTPSDSTKPANSDDAVSQIPQ